MMHPSDTPPDGDFARYVERLTDANAATAAREDLLQLRVSGPAGTPFAASSGMPFVRAVPTSMTALSFFEHVKWVLVAWIAAWVLAKRVPGAGFLFIPALLAYAIWVIFRVNRNACGTLVKRVRDLARNAAGKDSQAQPTNNK